MKVFLFSITLLFCLIKNYRAHRAINLCKKSNVENCLNGFAVQNWKRIVARLSFIAWNNDNITINLNIFYVFSILYRRRVQTMLDASIYRINLIFVDTFITQWVLKNYDYFWFIITFGFVFISIKSLINRSCHSKFQHLSKAKYD